MTMPARPCVYALAQHGDALTTRSLGHEVGRRIRAKLRRHDVLILSFAGVLVVSRPFVDELLGCVQEELAKRHDRVLVAHAINSNAKEHIRTILERRGMVLAVLHGGRVVLWGGGGRRLREVLRASDDLEEEFSASELAERASMSPAAVDRPVQMLVEAGVLSGRRRGRSREVRLRRPPAVNLQALTH